MCHGVPTGVRHARGGIRLLSCPGCQGLFLDESVHPYAPDALYDESYYTAWDMSPGSPAWKLRTETAAARLQLLRQHGGAGRLLDVGCAGGYLVAEALAQGFDAHGLEISGHAVRVAAAVAPGRVRQGQFEGAGFPAASFDAVTAFDLVEHHPEPHRLLSLIHDVLRPGGLFAATVPDLSSVTGRLMGGAWPHLKEEHRFYPTRSGFRALLAAESFVVLHEEPARKRLSLSYLAPLFDAYPVPILTPAFSFLARIAPASLREARFTGAIGERLYVARREP